MAEYVCKVADTAGRVFQQVEAAQSASEARQKLADRGFFVYSVDERFGALARLFPGRAKGVGSVNTNDFLVFNQQFNTLIKAGLPILKSLELLAERAAAPKLRPIINDVRQRVREGALLSEAMAEQPQLPRVYTTAILAGERSGNLSGVLDYFINYQRITSGFRRRLLASLVYPFILVVSAVGIVLYLVTYVLPQFAKLYQELNIPLPLTTRILTTIALDYRWGMLTFVALAVVTLAGLLLWSRSERGGVRVDRWKLKIPLFGETWLKFQIAQFSRTLSTLLAGGTPLVNALETSSEAITSRLIATSVFQAAQRVREGQSLHSALVATGLMPEVALEMIEVGEATGALAAMLNSVAEFYEEDVNLRLSAAITLINPAILIVMAFLIGFILISLYLPIFSFSIGGGIPGR